MPSLIWSYISNHIPGTGYPYVGEAVDCPVCNSAKHRVISRWDRRMKRLTTALCDDCGLFFTNPMPTDSELAAYYRDMYRFDYQRALFKPKRNHVAVKEREAEQRFSIMRNFLREGAARFLDFGCGSGELVRRFAQEGHDAHGFEPGSRYAAFGNDAINDGEQHIDTARWQDLAYAPGSFDAISMIHVLEHLRDPVPALARLHGWLSDDGFAYVEVPDMQSYELKGSQHFHFAHVLGFSRANFIHAAEKAGFRLAHEFGGTSMIFRKRPAHEPPSMSAAQLQAAAARNRAEYSRRPGLVAQMRYHQRRLLRIGGAAQTNTIAASAMAGLAVACGEI